MRKTTAYSRKRQAGHSYNAAAWVNVLQKCAPYGELQTIAGFDVSTSSAADKAEAIVMGAFESLMAHTPPADVERLFDVLAHAIGLAVIRSLQIEPDESRNPSIDRLKAGTRALQRAITRWRDNRQFGLDAEGRQALPEAIEIYRAILQSSSPAQMEHAANERIKIIKKVRLQ